jgi:hypothetical protein
MRKLLGIAALIATGGTAVGAGALNMLGSDTLGNISTEVISECTGAGGVINYLGTGSGNGESAMIDTITGAGAGTLFATGQKIAPMSRFMNNNICTNGVGATNLQTATGLVVGLDGIVIAASVDVTNGGPSGTNNCNAANNGLCSSEPAGGMAYNTTITYCINASGQYVGLASGSPLACPTGDTLETYTFTTWKDILSVLFAGWSHESASTITGNGGVNSGCASPLRSAIANNWGSFFEISCANPDGCTELQHIFRRDDASGTSDAVATLLGLKPSPVAESNFGFGTTPYCNANVANVAATTDGSGASPIQITTTTAHHLTTGQGVQIVGVGLDVGGNATVASGNIAADGVWAVTVVDALNFTLNGSAGTGTAGLTKVGNYAMVLLPPSAGLGASGSTATTPGGTVAGLADYVPTNYRDLDPVRRPCANGGSANAPLEDVCSRDNQLGLVLVIPDAPSVFNNGTAAGEEAQYPGSTNNFANVCTGTNLAVQAAKYTDPIQSAPGSLVTQLAQCPNGDTPHNGNQCTTPVNSGAATTACLNSASNKPSIIFNSHNTLATPSPLQTLGLVYNTRLMTPSKQFQVDGFSNPIVGAYYRIHEQDVIAGYGGGGTAGGNGTIGANCVNKDATDQIGCLVQASPCSIGYAGREALQWSGTPLNAGLQVNTEFPDVLCITGSDTSTPAVAPFSYPLSRKLYLDSIQGWGAASAGEKAMALCETSETGLTPTHLSNIITSFGFFNFAVQAPNAAQPFAEDFNEEMVCTGSSAVSGLTPATVGNSNSFNPATLAGMPAVGTTCGNGIKEAYEDCDDGTPGAAAGASPAWPTSALPNGTNGGNGGSASNCSTTCRWTNAGFTGDPNGTTTGSTTCASAANGTNCTTSAGFTPSGAAGKCQNSACLAN